MKIHNSSIERVEEFKHLGTTLTNKNSIQEEIKSRLKLGNACYYSVQNLLSSSLLSKKLKIKIYRNIILPVVLYGCGSWSLKLGEERRLRVFENRVLRRVFGPKRDEVTGEWRKLHNEELSDLLVLYWAISASCYEIHRNHKNALWAACRIVMFNLEISEVTNR